MMSENVLELQRSVVPAAKLVPAIGGTIGNTLPAAVHTMARQKKRKQRHTSADTEGARLESRIYEMQVRICKALANPIRLHILDLLGKRPYTVSGLKEALGVPLANVSAQLATLKAAGVVMTRKEGRQVYCSLALPEVKTACHFIRRVLRAQVRSAQNLRI